MHSVFVRLLGSIAGLLLAATPLATSASVNDVTTSVQQLGNAVNSIYPGQGLSCAQDLQLFGGKIFLGYGNLDNRASKSVLYLDPTDRLFKIDSPTTKLEDEILRHFRVFGSEMYVESFDPISSLSNLYLRRSGSWSIRGMSFSGSGRHNFDIYKFNNILFTGGGVGFPGIAMSLNSGTNWILPGASITNSVFYDGEFFEFGGKLYVSQDLSYSKLVPTLAAPFLLQYNGSTNTPFLTVCAQPSSFYPSGDPNEGKIIHFQTLRNKGVFIGDGGLYTAVSISTPTLSKVTLPNQVGDTAVDLIARTNGVYYLASVPHPPGAEFPYLGVIGKSEDLQTWVEICRFGASEAVQSLEIVNGDFYVGLGSYLTTANPHSGDVLLIPRTNANEERAMVTPGNLEFANGRAGNTFPFSAGKSVRFQQVYTNTVFANIPGPQLITHIAFRPTAFGGQAFTTTVQNVRVTLSTTAASPLKGLSSTFAANIGSDVTTVYSGSLRLASRYSGPTAGPKDFDVEIPLQNPFYYDPARGNLLLDIQNFSSSTSTPLDVTWGAGLPCSRMVSAAGGVTNSTGVADATPTCLITKFKMRPALLTNRPPLIFAGFGETLTLPNLATLSGSAQDDGLPNPPNLVTSLWTKVSGPGNVVFGNPQTLTTTAAFSTSGAYVLRLTAGDGALSASSDVCYNVLPVPPLNLAPVVSAGPNQIMTCTNLTTGKRNSAQLNGLITDDGYPQPPGITTLLWSKVSGPGTVTFATTTAPLTSATFSLPGAYVLRLTASDGQLSATSDVTVSVATTTTANQPPSVNAGPELTATQLAPVPLKGQVTDDGLPSSPGSLSLAWTKVSGPGSVQFDSPANSVTTATFSLPGDYALRLSASDGSAQASSQTTVHVLNGQFVVVPNTLTNSNGRSGNSYPFNLGNSVRYQQVYLASQFPSTGGPFLISAIAFRPSAFSGAAFTSSVPNLVLDLATTTASPSSGLSATFADNVGPDKQTVFSGALTLSSKFTGAGPKAFDIIIPLQRAFSYDPSSGNLLLDIRLPSALHTTDLDCTWGTGIPTSRLVSRAGGVDDAQGSGDATPTALITQFTVATRQVSAPANVVVVANQPPSVDAGPDLTGTLTSMVTLAGQVSDDGLSNSPEALAVSWTKQSGPGSVQFGSSSSAVTTAAFSLPGVYVLRLTASDGNAQSSDEATVSIMEDRRVVVPNTLSNLNGRAGNYFPFKVAGSVRYQQVYMASQFPTSGGPFLISQIAFRPSAFSGGAFTSTVPNLVVEISTTKAAPSKGLSVTFADNVGVDKQTVYSGSLTLSSQFIGTGPKAFDVIIPLQKPFSYDPKSGNLLLDIRVPSSMATTEMDSTWGSGIPASRVFSRVGGVNDAQGSRDVTPTALVTLFKFTSMPVSVAAVPQVGGAAGLLSLPDVADPSRVETSTNLVDWTLLPTDQPFSEALALSRTADNEDARFYRGSVTAGLTRPEIIGVSQLKVGAGANYLSIPFQPGMPYRGKALGLATNSVTFAGTPNWVEGELGSRNNRPQYIVKVVKDASGSPGVEGDWWYVTSNTANTVTVSADTDNLATHLRPGDELEVQQLTSIRDVFGFGDTCLLTKDQDLDAVKTDEDVVRTLVGTGFADEVFYHDGTSGEEGYYLNGDFAGDGSAITLNPDQPIVWFRKTGVPSATLRLHGRVQNTPLTHYLVPGPNAVGVVFPIGAPLATSQLTEAGWTSDSNFEILKSEEDILCSLNRTGPADLIFHHRGADDATGWYVNGSKDETCQFQPNKVYLLFLKGPGPILWRQPAPFGGTSVRGGVQ